MTIQGDKTSADCNSNGGFATIDVSGLRVGAMLRSPIYDAKDDKNVLLVAAGTLITASVLKKLDNVMCPASASIKPTLIASRVPPVATDGPGSHALPTPLQRRPPSPRVAPGRDRPIR